MVATLNLFSALLLQGGNWDLRGMIHNMGTLALTVVVILFLLSVYSFGVMIDRALMYSAARKQSRIFVQQVAGALKDGKLDEAIAIAERNKKSHIAKVVATGLSEFQSASQQVSDSDVIDAAKRGLERSVAIVHAEMKRGLSALATIGSTAPFVGLFGTVVGILNAFKGIAANKATGLSAVAGGISEALVTTAFGLLVAVPAVWAYNYFTNKVEAFDDEMEDADKDDAIVVAVTRDGSIFLGNTKVSKEDITGQIKDRISTRLDKTVYVKSDARAKYGDVVAVVDEIRSPGVDQLGLLTEKNQKGKSAASPPPAD